MLIAGIAESPHQARKNLVQWNMVTKLVRKGNDVLRHSSDVGFVAFDRLAFCWSKAFEKVFEVAKTLGKTDSQAYLMDGWDTWKYVLQLEISSSQIFRVNIHILDTTNLDIYYRAGGPFRKESSMNPVPSTNRQIGKSQPGKKNKDMKHQMFWDLQNSGCFFDIFPPQKYHVMYKITPKYWTTSP